VCRKGEKPRKFKKTEFSAFQEAGWQRGREIREIREILNPIPRQYVLNGDEIAEIRRLYAIGEYRQSDLADRFGVSQGYISRTVRHISLPGNHQQVSKLDVS